MDNPTLTKADLLPCPNPWCVSTSRPLPAFSTRSETWAIVCGCGVRSFGADTEDEAREKWNTRHSASSGAAHSGRKVVERAVADDLITAIYEAEGWQPKDKGEFSSRSARAQSLYQITVDPRRNRYIATPLALSPETRSNGAGEDALARLVRNFLAAHDLSATDPASSELEARELDAISDLRYALATEERLPGADEGQE